MSRREILTAAELTLAASALSAAVYGLVRAAYDPYAAVAWVPIAIIGAGTALALVGLAAILFVGRAALLLAGDAAPAVRRWLQVRRLAAELAALPPARRRPPADEGHTEHRKRAGAEQPHAAAMATVAAEPWRPQTIGYTAVMPTVTVAGVSWGFGPRGVVEPERAPWTAQVSAAAGQHAGDPTAEPAADLAAWGRHEVGGVR